MNILVCGVRVESNYYGDIDFQNNARGEQWHVSPENDIA